MAELVDALVLGTNIFGCEGSSPFRPTNYEVLYIIETICPMTIVKKNNYLSSNYYINLKKMIVSPCISICKTDPSTGFCYGYARTIEERKMWKQPETSDEWKENNLREIKERLSGWQLESFNEYYEHKKNNGISLFKKNLIKE